MTHIQPAQPVLLAHHLLAYVEMLERDRGRLADCRRRANVSPLGLGRAGRRGLSARPRGDGEGARLRRRDCQLARRRQRPRLRRGGAGRVRAVHGPPLRLAEEITWWSNPRFGFVRAADSFSTGSSMMPNKKNPDPAELVRGKSARVIGALTGMLTLLKGLPLAYQKDMQDDKPPLFDAAATLEASLLRHGRDGRDPDRGPRADAGRGRRGIHHRHGRGRRPRPAGSGFPGRSPHRGRAGRRSGAGRSGARRAGRRHDRGALSGIRRFDRYCTGRAMPRCPGSCGWPPGSTARWPAATSSAVPLLGEWPRPWPPPGHVWGRRPGSRRPVRRARCFRSLNVLIGIPTATVGRLSPP